MNRLLTGLILGSLVWIPAPRFTAAQETVIVTEQPPATAPCGPACNTRDRQSPPWHGSMAAAECGPPCRYHPGTFHADPRGQLCVHRQLSENCATMPPFFPRLHACCHEGRMPTPRPLHVPHCRQCGAPIEGGF